MIRETIFKYQIVNTLNGIIISTVLLFVFECQASTDKELKPFLRIDHVMGIAHRGGAELGPENTLMAFELASELEMDAIELDVHITKDNHIVVIHDYTIDRTTNGTGRVKDFTLDQLKEFDAAYWFSPDGGETFPYRGKGVTVPTLDEVFDNFSHMRINIDIKQNKPVIVDLILTTVKEYNLSEQVNIFSFFGSVIKQVRRTYPEISNAFTIAETLNFLAFVQQGRIREFDTAGDVFQIPLSINEVFPVASEFIEAAHSQNLMVHVWTIDDKAIMEEMVDLGVDGIITDRPDLFNDL